MSEDAGIVPKTVGTLVLALIRSNHSARSHLLTSLSLQTRYRCPQVQLRREAMKKEEFCSEQKGLQSDSLDLE